MPFYAYDCADCGPFEQSRPMALFAEPCPCPACGAQAPRQLALAMVKGIGEKTGTVRTSPQAGRHRSGCGCCAAPPGKSFKAEATAGAAKAARPVSTPAFLTRS